MNTTQTHKWLSVCLVSLFVITGCGPIDDDNDNPGAGPNVSRDNNIDDCPLFSDAYGSNIGADTTVAADQCLRVDQSISVGGEAHLTIEPGVRMYFAESTTFSLSGGTISAAGTDQDPILLSGQAETPGAWLGVSVASDSAVNALEHVVIEYGGGNEEFANLTIREDSRIAVDNTTLRQSATAGLRVRHSVELRSFKDNAIAKNDGAPIDVDVASLAELDASTTFDENGESSVHVRGGEVAGEDLVWNALGVPYHVAGTVKVHGGETSLTIGPGATFEFAEKVSLNVAGAVFVVAGESDNKVTFTGSQKMKGWWSGVTLHDTDRAGNKIEHAVIEYGGNEESLIGTTGLCLHCDHHPSNLQLHGDRGTLQVAINDTVIRQGSAAGLYADANAYMTSFENNGFADNDGPSANIHPRNIGELETSSTFGSEVEVHGGTIEDGEEYTWPAIDARYRVSDSILVRGEETRINIDAGGTYAFDEQKYFAVAAAILTVNGESDNKVTFTGTTEQAGWWSGITLHDTDRSANKIEHAVIAYAGNDKSPLGTTAMCLHCDNNPANLQLAGIRGAVQMSLSNVAFNSSSALGLFVDSNVALSSCSGLQFDGNATDWGSNDSAGEGNLTGSCSL